MSLLNWFSRRSGDSVPPSAPDSSTPAASPATVPSHTVPLDPAAEHPAGGRKQERSERRESLYAVVKETLTQVGVLSSSYTYKVLSLDPHGREFVVMMDVPAIQARDPGRLAEIEALIARNAKGRHGLLVTAVYWRVNDHVTAEVTAQSLAQVPPRAAAAAPPAPLQPAAVSIPIAVPVAAPVAAPVLTADGVLADEISAFRKAMAEGVRPTHASAGRPEGGSDFADTEIQEIKP